MFLEVPYIEYVRLDDELNVCTGIDFIKNSSLRFKHIVEKADSKGIIARGGGVVVHIDRITQKPMLIPQEFYDAVKMYEK